MRNNGAWLLCCDFNSFEKCQRICRIRSLITNHVGRATEATGTFKAIEEYQKAGGSFAVCTGRDLGSARGVLKGLDIDNMPGAADFSSGI